MANVTTVDKRYQVCQTKGGFKSYNFTLNAPASPGLSEFLQVLSHFYLHKEVIFGNPYSSATVVSICNTLSSRGMAPPCQFWESFVEL